MSTKGKFWFIDISSISYTYFEKSDNAVPNNFHFYAEKIGEGLEKQVAFLFLTFFFPEQNEGIFSYLGYEILI